MSTVNYLDDSIKVIVDLGIYSQEKADKVSHCTDDAVFALSDLTDVLCENPKIMEQLKSAIEKKKKRKN